jgi:benzylsuccinate CoA-transferase BbsF subunit
MIDFVGEEVLAAQVRGADAPRRGNRHPFYAPQGCYRCAGADRWIALSITGDAQWQSLCSAAGFDRDWADLRLDQRLDAHDAIDAAVAAWAATQDHLELMRSLQDAGIAAVAAVDARELVENEHLAARGFYATLTHADAGTFVFPGLPAHLSSTPATYRRAAPGLGEHNREVLGEMLGMSDGELDALRAAGVIADEPPA